MSVKTRFAPSPTGFLHVGSARTALFNWLYARHHQGEFILRIEDTDRERSKKEFEEEILESLKWLGLDWEGDLTYQSARTDLYRRAADGLLKKGLAYPEGQALRFKSPKETIAWEDAIRGRVEFDGSLLDDLVIIKSDGGPTYNFACVVDDGRMGITHVIRGEDHVSNTPKQLPLYRALGFNPPKYAHIPLILGEDRSRLSKRHGATSVRDFRLAGYLPEAMANYLALLGWSPGDDREVMGRQELIERFTLDRVQSSGAVFDIKKLQWMNGEYLRALPEDKLKALFLNVLKDAGVCAETPEEAWMNRFTGLYRERVVVLGDLPEASRFFFDEDVEWDEEGDKVLRKFEGIGDAFLKYADILEGLGDFGHESVEKASRDFMKDAGLSGRKFIHPARVAITGRTASPGFFETVSLLGKPATIKRLRDAADRLRPK